MPTPVSVTWTFKFHLPLSSYMKTWIVILPSKVNFRAFDTKLSRICCILYLSVVTSELQFEIFVVIRVPMASAWCC